ncbi:MAG: agmatinase [Bacteroidales bacterium]|nr:agmatinase [Bacteroidales bacterium]
MAGSQNLWQASNMAITNFGGDEVIYGYDESKVIILPVPFDATSTYLRGADKGPEAIFEASQALEFYDPETGSEAHKVGIHTLPPLDCGDDPAELTEEVYKSVSRLFSEQRFPVVIGGNHTVSIGAFRAAAEAFSGLTILQLDAHSDLRPVYEGSPLNHACAAARAKEYAPLVQVGIRSMAAEELPFVDRERIFYAHELWADRSLYTSALELLSDNIYITLDLDVFDPSIMPSTGTPEPGGPDYRELMFFLRDIFSKRNVIGFDVVELCPSPTNKAPDFMAARVIYQMLSYKFGL